MEKKLNPQSKANLIEAPGVAIIIQTDDQRSVVLTPALALDLARKILSFSAPVDIPANPIPGRGRLVQ